MGFTQQAPLFNQGPVIGPALFLIYINDLPDSIQSESRLFADDTIIYRQIHTQQHCLLLQQDLQQLEMWEQHWQMSFHPDKCITIRFTRKRHPIIHQYQLHNHTLPTHTNDKYLGVTFSVDLRWSTHIQNITTQANRTLGLVRRNIGIGSPTIKQRAYQALVPDQYQTPRSSPKTRSQVDHEQTPQYIKCHCHVRTPGMAVSTEQKNWHQAALSQTRYSDITNRGERSATLQSPAG